MRKILFLIAILLQVKALATEWPESHWLNERPRPEAVLSAIAFVSPVDLQFFRMLNVWKKLDKRYHSVGVEFLMVARSEPNLPFSEDLVQSHIREANYKLPVYVDESASYAKLWRAYISPTVNLVLPSGKIVGFDPGNFDPAVYEKMLQRTLKDTGIVNIPPREFINEGETRFCGHAKTIFLGEKFQKTLGSSILNIEGTWTPKPFWIEKHNSETFSLEIQFTKSNVALIAESPNPAKITLTLDNGKIPAEVRGLDVQEDKSGISFLNVKNPKLYEIIQHSTHLKDSPVKLKLVSSAKGLKLWLIESLPFCQDFAL